MEVGEYKQEGSKKKSGPGVQLVTDEDTWQEEENLSFFVLKSWKTRKEQK